METQQTPQLVNTLKRGAISHAPALPFKRAGFYADMALITSEGNTKIVAEGVDLPNGAETFYLNLQEYEEDQYWPNKQGQSAWPPRSEKGDDWSAVDLVTEIRRAGLETVLGRNRQVHLYRHAGTLQIDPRGLLRSAAAVSFGSGPSRAAQLLIYATSEFPCSLEVAMDPVRIEAILVGLEEVCEDDAAAHRIDG